MASNNKHIHIIDLGELNGNGLTQQTDHKKIVCKFLLVEDDAQVHFLFGPIGDYPYHANLLDTFCTENDIPSHWENQPDFLEILSDEHVLRGGGWLLVDPERNQLVVSGRSNAYGKFDAALVNAVVASSELFRGRDTVVE